MNSILFLGTGAADWNINDRKEGEFFRRNSSTLINRDLLVDPGAHIFDYAEKNDSAILDGVKYVLVTHNHGDHVNADSVKRLAKNCNITVFCSNPVRERIGDTPNVTFITPEIYKSVTLGTYTVLPLLANHDDVLNSFHYIIKTADGKEIFYGLDGAWFLRPTWEEMKAHRFDMAILDCTVGDFDDWRLFEHNTVPMLRKMTAEMKRLEMMKENGVMVASHLARTLHPSHEECVEIFAALDMVTAFDGMILTV
ncbi:MAG: hypothetical protein E7613_04530 [Ruminococcaceae bacterium]|nr:hypothetical protein [Oscillospiraceae bacterium]